MTENKANINFFSEDIDFELENEGIIKTKIIEYIENTHHSCGNINYIFCSDDYLLDMNKRYLDHNYYTDILSFQLNDEPIEGDIFISVDRVKDNAVKFGSEFEDELLRVISHGILHFLGYKDDTEEGRAIMRQKEDEFIKFLKN